MTTTHDTHLLLWICKLHQSVHWRYREDPTESFQSCSTVMCEFVYKERSSSSFKYSAREKIDWCRKVIRSHLQSNSCWHHIFLLLSSGSSLHKLCITVLYFWVFGLSESIQLATLKLKARVQSRLKMVLGPLIGLDDLFLRVASVAVMSKVKGLKHCTKMWATDGHFPTKKWIHCSSMCDFRA